MIQLAYIRENKQDVIARLAVKNMDATHDIEEIYTLDIEKRRIQTELEMLLAEQNSLAKQIGELFKSGKKAEAEDLRNRSTAIKETCKSLEEKQTELEEQIKAILIRLPNLPSPQVPAGKTAEDNEVFLLDEHFMPKLDDTSLPHWEQATKYDIIDC